MEVVIVASRFPFVLGGFGLLFCSSFGTTFFTVEIIHAVESHIGKITS